MMPTQPKPPDPTLQYAQVLYGWAEIAACLRRSVATVQRWHKERALLITSMGFTIVIPMTAESDLVKTAAMAQRSYTLHRMAVTPKGASNLDCCRASGLVSPRPPALSGALRPTRCNLPSRCLMS